MITIGYICKLYVTYKDKSKRMARRINQNLYKGLKKHWGSIKMLGERTGFTRQYVRGVLQGSKHNLDILESGAKLLKELEAKRARRISHIQKTIDHAERIAV